MSYKTMRKFRVTSLKCFSAYRIEAWQDDIFRRHRRTGVLDVVWSLFRRHFRRHPADDITALRVVFCHTQCGGCRLHPADDISDDITTLRVVFCHTGVEDVICTLQTTYQTTSPH